MELLTKCAIAAIENGLLGDSIIRSLVRKLCQARLKDLERANVSCQTFAAGMRESPIAPVPEKANEQHYELPAGFFELILGERLKYSCCFFENENCDLNQAEIVALEATCQRAELTDGMNILELGCGWGSLTLWMLDHLPNASITAVSNSRYQREVILEKAASIAATDRLTVITADMNEFETGDKFDRVLSCEMFEHMRNYERLLSQISTWLKPQGKLFVHIFCHKKFIYEFETEGAANWMGQYFFTGGIMPAANVFDEFQRDMKVTQSWEWDGTHYEKTCNEWLKLLDSKKLPAMNILKEAYGAKEGNRWFHRWRLFMIAGAELFGFNNGTEWQVGHYLLDRVD